MTIVEKKSFTVVGLPVTATWQQLHEKMPTAWKLFKERLTEIAGRKNDVMMDLSLDVADGRYRQFIGVEVEGDPHLPDDMEKVTIPSQTYIYEHHEGDITDIAQTFGAMYDWAEQQEVDAGDFKIDYGYTRDRPESPHDLYIKIED
ncbi:GyrI-like domain-containing protein [Fodinibius sediminis]|uniref:Predicted transcriptional regulator YdeE, contains AraC-type DNA-binding domain n=1 Tax=Fodinibius sediminis TaxID=1214077 RepID=A0A521AQI9_9BACT|nr:effector binding domain-containing protein [Fodinibius sediminis]SMO37094.1 Predicted transcriptional regulator YdeE, contains AraC-type DNA-binding domain [Fodinibius sediminis]